MISVARQLIDSLQSRGDLAWYRYAGGFSDDGRATAPVVIWRFAGQTPGGLEESLSKITSSESRLVRWNFGFHGRNWVLLPSRVLEIQKNRDLPTDMAAVGALAEEDQSFCVASVHDFEAIVGEFVNAGG